MAKEALPYKYRCINVYKRKFTTMAKEALPYKYRCINVRTAFINVAKYCVYYGMITYLL